MFGVALLVSDRSKGRWYNQLYTYRLRCHSQLSLFAKHYTMNRLPGQAEKTSAPADIEKGEVDSDNIVGQDAQDLSSFNDVDRSKSIETQGLYAEGKSPNALGEERLPELESKAKSIE